ncbi:S-layer homology domain-containing protein [Paenibacillus sp. BR2-3]|uniref:S-layer homology domain-containing protein n=1 Tax=Paenibacillus sp. BR2-3 TaxID=3048494 RepID=UPI003977CC63
MNMKKSALTAITTASLLSFSLGGQIFAAEGSFKDLGSVNGKEKIISLKDQGLIKGVSASQFLPQNKVTPSYQGSIQRSLKYNITTLDASGKFNPKSEITRAEAAIMLYNALEYLKSHSVETPFQE